MHLVVTVPLCWNRLSKKKVEKLSCEELQDIKTHLDKQTQDTMVFKRECKDKENGRVQGKRGSYKESITSTPRGSGARKSSTAWTPSSTLQDSVNRNPSMSPNETNMHPWFKMTTNSLFKLADGMPPPLMHPRRKLSNKFPDTDLGKSLRKPFKIRSLYSPIEQIFDIIHLDVLHCKDKSKDVVLTLHANGFLGRWSSMLGEHSLWILQFG